MSEQVKKFALFLSGYDGPHMGEHVFGEYVAHKDYELLESRLAHVTEERDRPALH